MSDPQAPITATLRVRMGQGDAHYGGNLVDGARTLALFGDVITEIAVITDGDEGLFVGYEKIEFLAPVYAGDFLEVTGTVTRIGNTSRTVSFEARKVIASRYDLGTVGGGCPGRARGDLPGDRDHGHPEGALPEARLSPRDARLSGAAEAGSGASPTEGPQHLPGSGAVEQARATLPVAVMSASDHQPEQ